MNARERDIESALRGMIKRNGGECLKFSSPGNTGVPDQLCIIPGRPPFFVELKRPEGGRVSAKQNYWIDRLRSLGVEAFTLHSRGEIEDLEKRIQAERREKWNV